MERSRQEVSVLYRDEHLIVAVKPYGVLSEPHDSRPNLPAMLREQEGCEVFPVHRLDRTTEGLIVYAVSPDSAAALSAAMQNGAFEKTYLAAAEGELPDSGEMTDLLYFDRKRGKSYVVKRERKGVKQARLNYRRIGLIEREGRTVSLVRVRLYTGRTHQIRVQFASRKTPLVGDRRYGSRIPAEQIALCAYRLRFPHPETGERMTFEIQPQNELLTQA